MVSNHVGGSFLKYDVGAQSSEPYSKYVLLLYSNDNVLNLL